MPDSSAPIDSWPLAGNIRANRTYWDAYPNLRRDGACWLIACDVNTGGVGVELPHGWGAPAFHLGRNSPNPFNPMTEITYELLAPGAVDLRIFDLAGRLVRTLQAGVTEDAGVHHVQWDGADHQRRAVPSGVYLYQMQAGFLTSTRRMALIR